MPSVCFVRYRRERLIDVTALYIVDSEQCDLALWVLNSNIDFAPNLVDSHKHRCRMEKG